MDKIGFFQMLPSSAPAARKEKKKKQVKDELDRKKQAEKKKRRLEKALATSAAIRSELEKKKQKKKEEQQRLDEEGAAIAEAVALYVLLGEDSDEPCHVVLNKKERFDVWGHGNIGLDSLAGEARNIGLFMGEWKRGLPYQNHTKYSLERVGWVSDYYGSECKWNNWELGQLWSPRMIERDFSLNGGRLLSFGGGPTHAYALMENRAPIFKESGFAAGISAGIIASQALSSLKIAENMRSDAIAGVGAAKFVIDGVLEHRHLENKVNLCKEF